MKTQRTIAPIVALLLMAGCVGIEPGHDPVLVNAQRVMVDSKATFELIEKTEYQTYSAFKAANPGMAAKVRTFVNKIRDDKTQWLNTANSLYETYRTSKTEENKNNLDTAIDVLQAALSQSTEYLAMLRPYKTT